ncbi:MAG: MGH1-like glycoside hydrolase domain-containing protein [Planctomycetota bacterium]
MQQRFVARQTGNRAGFPPSPTVDMIWNGRCQDHTAAMAGFTHPRQQEAPLGNMTPIAASMCFPTSESLRATAEHQRLLESKQRHANWQRWGTYLSERQWGTVREDYSLNQDAWGYFPHDHARSRAYRWGEDGLLGICDRQGRLCFSFAFWNTRDPILKERLFGLSGPEGNHGEDVKECYYYVDGTPTHSYMRGLYKYPQTRFPYDELTSRNNSRSRYEDEFEILDTATFSNDAYFDCQIEYCKSDPDDILIRLTVFNRGSSPAVLHILPQLWYHNSWAWGCTHEGCEIKPRLKLYRTDSEPSGVVVCDHPTLGHFEFRAESDDENLNPQWLFTENETNPRRHPGAVTSGEIFKDAFHDYVVEGAANGVDSRSMGTKSAAHYVVIVEPGKDLVVRCRLSGTGTEKEPSVAGAGGMALSNRRIDASFDAMFEQRIREADEFYEHVIPSSLTEEHRNISRQAYAGLVWTKQFYYYVIDSWLTGDPNAAPLSPERKFGRNHDWIHLFNRDVISMPDKWEYPWYAVWDLAFHMIPMARIDMEFAKEQMILFLREWYMHPNGQIPAYEWALSDVNPPVHAWACWQIYKLCGDREFLARTFQKLLLNFTWWVNRKDVRGQHVFSGGFLGLDNIGVFDRSKPLPGGGTLDQADATAWMAVYCGCMLQMALELADESQAYCDMASKFFEHYVEIAEAMNSLHGTGLWENTDGFYYDHLYHDGKSTAMKVRSLVGLIPIFTNVMIHESKIQSLPGFQRRMNWFIRYRPDMALHMTYMESPSDGSKKGMRLLAIPSHERFLRLLSYMLDENEFLSPYGIRSLSAIHREKPFVFEHAGRRESVSYVPGESNTGMFGGNSNWRGPVWFPINYLIVQSLREYYAFYGESFQVECPTGSGVMMNLHQVADEIERRLVSLFAADPSGARPCHGSDHRYRDNEEWRNLILFFEYFHGDHGRGLGASHQTGWTALVATMLEHQATRSSGPPK